MKLYTFYKDEDKVVYGAAVNGKPVFFFSGFASAEEAKAPIGTLEAEINMTLSGEWSEIE